MKPTTVTPHLLQDANALNEEILEAAEKIDGESLAPEVSSRTAEITVWDESPEDVGWRVQGNCQIHLQRLLAEFGNCRNQAHCRNGHVSRAQVKAIRTVQYAQCLHHIVIIMQRFTHTHQDNIGNMINRGTARKSFCRPWCISQLASKEEYLSYDFSRAEMTIKTHLTCSAECTTKSTTGLCRYTYSRAGAALTNGRIEHKHRFDEFPIIEFQQDFARAIIFGVQFTPYNHWSDTSFLRKLAA